MITGIPYSIFQRNKTGKGQFVDIAMLDAMISLNERMVMLYIMTGEESHRGRLKHIYPRGEAEKILNENGVPASSVYTAKDIFESELVKARRSLIDIEDPDMGTYQFARGPIMLSDAPEIETNPASDLGQHTHEILSSILGYSDELINSNTIGIKP